MNQTTIVLLLAVLVAATLVIAPLAAAASAITKSIGAGNTPNKRIKQSPELAGLIQEPQTIKRTPYV
jgi:hypothetical protein